MSTSTERMRRLRERRAAALEAAPARVTGDDGPLTAAVRQSIASLPPSSSRAAAEQLALRYAVTMDQAEDPAWAARWIGPLLQRSLLALGVTVR